MAETFHCRDGSTAPKKDASDTFYQACYERKHTTPGQANYKNADDINPGEPFRLGQPSLPAPNRYPIDQVSPASDTNGGGEKSAQKELWFNVPQLYGGGN